MVKLPLDLYHEVKALADREGLPLGDYLTRVVATAHQYAPPAYCYPPVEQEELPIAQAS